MQFVRDSKTTESGDPDGSNDFSTKKGTAMTNKFFLYDPAGDGFQTFPTAKQRDAAAKAAIEDSLDDDGWMEDVFSIVVGEITGAAMKTDIEIRPSELDENGEDEEGNYWDTDVQEKHNVEILPIAEMEETAK